MLWKLKKKTETDIEDTNLLYVQSVCSLRDLHKCGNGLESAAAGDENVGIRVSDELVTESVGSWAHFLVWVNQGVCTKTHQLGQRQSLSVNRIIRLL